MIDELIEKLGYRFKDETLLVVALTHRSKSAEHNERLEFLGDAVVNFVIAEVLFQQYPQATEGELSRWRAALVNRDALAELARKFMLGDFLILGTGEIRSGGHARHSILSCTMEAIIGAIYLDAGYATTRKKILQWYRPLLKMLSSASSHKDPKTILQEYLQAKRIALPYYQVEQIEGEAHQQNFIVSCTVNGVAEKTTGQGTSRRRAEQEAAQLMLKLLSASTHE